MCWEKWKNSKVVLVPTFTRYNIVPTMNLPNQFSPKSNITSVTILEILERIFVNK